MPPPHHPPARVALGTGYSRPPSSGPTEIFSPPAPAETGPRPLSRPVQPRTPSTHGASPGSPSPGPGPTPSPAPPSVQFTTSINAALPRTDQLDTPTIAAQVPTLAVPSNVNSDANHAAASAHIELMRPLFAVAAVGVLTALVTVAIFDRERGAGVAVGAVLATANFWIFSRIGTAVLRRPERGPSFALVAALKLAVLFSAVLAVLKGQLAGPIDFLAGYLALPVGIVVAQLLGRRSFLQHQHSTF